jgi:hypothetical protein
VVSSAEASRHPLLPGRHPSLLNLHKRTAIIGLLLAAIVVGADASGHRLTEHGPWHNRGGPVALTLELVLAALLLTLRSIRRRALEPSYLTARLRLLLHRTICTAMVVVAAVVVSSLVWPSLKNYYANSLVLVPWAVSGRPPPLHVRGLSSGTVELVTYGGMTLLVGAVIVASVILLRRHAAAAEPAERADDDGANLRQAVESGLRALQSTGDARAAIIACYVAMEHSLATAGAARSSAETSAELLTIAAASGLLHGPAASKLTTLFYEARYSSHELPPGARDDARRALDAISADLQSQAKLGRPPDAAAASAFGGPTDGAGSRESAP